MAFYIGGQSYNIFINGIAYCLGIFSPSINESDIVLLSSDGYILADFDGIILLPQPSVTSVMEGDPISTSEDYTLKDLSGYYLTLKESE